MVFAKHGMSLDDALKYVQEGNAPAAETIANHLLKQNAKNVAAIRILALASSIRRDNAKAVALLKKCISMRPKEHTLYRDLGAVYLTGAKFDEGLDAYNRALKLVPDDPETVVGKADLLEKAGRFDACRESIERYINDGTATTPMFNIMARLEARQGNHDRAIELAMRDVNVPGKPAREVSMLWRIVGENYEKKGDYAKAFDAFQKSNSVFQARFNRQEMQEFADSMIAIFTRENLARIPQARDRSELPIFVSSKPRSGSTLVEQIIHSHPSAYGAGEINNFSNIVSHLQEEIGSVQLYPDCIADLTQQHVDDLAGRYLKEMRRLGPGAKRVANKNLDTYRHMGMIQIILPAARIINVFKDPLDNCFGIFMASLNVNHVPYSSTLEDIAFAHIQFERMMNHWRSVLDVKMLEVPYEQLVEDSDTWIRKIIEFTGLPWNDQCLRYYEAKRDVITLSYDQVRKPIYKSAVARWKKYEEFLGPLKKALAEAEVTS